MIAKPETLERLRVQAEAYAAEAVPNAPFAMLTVEAVARMLRTAYLRGTDAGYTARCAEERDS